jgi:hypothetical protein
LDHQINFNIGFKLREEIMAIVKKGTLTVATGGTAQNLNLGFVPSYIRLENKTKIVANTNGVQIAEWYDDNVNASAYLWTTTAGAPVISYTATNGVTPYIPSPGLEYVPLTGLPPGATSTNLTITGISKAAQASITATHAFTSADVGVTTVTFHSIVGMTQMNTLSGVIQSVTSTTSFTVNINSTSFTTYVSGGIANPVTGVPATTTTGFQTYNTPLSNVSFTGITLGSAIMVTTNDVWQYIAYLDAPFTSA